MGAFRDVISDGALGLFGAPVRFSDAPVVVGLIPGGPVAESQLRRALAISLGDPLVLLQSPMSATLLGIALIAAKFGLMRV